MRVDSDQRTDQRAGHAVRHRWLCAARQCRRRQADPDRHAHGRRRSQRTVIRVGAGSADGAGYTATISAVLDGAAKLVKTDLGTLVLSGINTYTGGTAVNGGTLQVSQDSNMGAWRARCRSTAARWPRPRRSTRRAPPRWARAAAASMSRRAPTSASPAPSAAAAREQAGHRHADPGRGQHLCRRYHDCRRNVAAGLGRGRLDGGHPRQRQQQRHAGVQPQQHVYRRHHQRRGQRRTDGLRHHRADRQQQLHRRHADFRRLQLGAGGATGSISGNVTNNGALVFNRGDTYTLAASSAALAASRSRAAARC